MARGKYASKEPGGDAEGASADAGAGPAAAEPAAVVVLRRANTALGTVEHVLLAVLLAVLVGVGSLQAVAAQLFNTNFSWSAEVIRYSVFFIAMLGAALAAQQMRMISMDVLTRVLSARARAGVRVLVAALVALLCALLIKSGLDVRESELGLSSHAEVIGPRVGFLALPVGAALVGLHYLLHGLIDVIYLARGQTAPEPAEAKVH